MNPLISIIIPTYNRVHILGETLTSVLEQTYNNWECLVVDDCSTDKTKELVYFYSLKEDKIKYFKNIHTKGGQGARNTGIKYSTGTFIIFLDSDDLLAKDCLEKRVNHFKNYIDNDFLVFQCNLFYDRPGDSYLVANYLFKDKDDISRFIMFDYPWYTGSPIIKRDFLIKNDLYWSENLKIHQDLDFYIKILCQNPKYKKIIDYPDIFFRMKGEDKLSESNLDLNFLKSKYQFLKNVFRYLKKNNLVENYKEELYGLSLSYTALLYKNEAYRLLLRIPLLLFSNGLYSFSIYLILDHLFQQNKDKFRNRIYKKLLSLYKFTFYEKRIKYLPPKGSTLGKVNIQEHMNNRKKGEHIENFIG